jgi:fatty acid desaturase
MLIRAQSQGMAIFERDDKVDYPRRQVLSSRNLRGGCFTDLILGGLNYQIGPHLFPSMPRPSLPRVQTLVRIPLRPAKHRVLRHFHTVGGPLEY